MRYPGLLFLCFLLQAGTVDRLAVTVGKTVITELQIDEELRVAALLNRQPLQRDVESRRAAADRLVEQLLINHEIELSRYPPPSDEEVSTLYSRIEETLGGEEELKQQCRQYLVSEEVLRDHLRAQLMTIRFIEVRFSPDVTISDSEIEAAYRRQVLSTISANAALEPPPLDAKERTRLSNSLSEERTDAALNSWLAESRKQVNILYIDSTLQ